MNQIADIGALFLKSYSTQVAASSWTAFAQSSIECGASTVYLPSYCLRSLREFPIELRPHAVVQCASAGSSPTAVVNAIKDVASIGGYSRILLDSPGGDLVSRMLFSRPLSMQQQLLTEYIGTAKNEGLSGVSVMLRSALACSYEGPYISPPRIADETMRLQNLSLLPVQEVIWEEGAKGLSQRALENVCKTSIAAGVDMSRVSLLFSANGHVTADLIKKATFSGSWRLVGSSCVSSLMEEYNTKCHTGEPLVSTKRVNYVPCSTILSCLVETIGDDCTDDLLDSIEEFIELEEKINLLNSSPKYDPIHGDKS
eukprot:Tbor_TRINITY_DN5545_c2_g1::TRINITY_DN5545_c2_g1_i1::g.13482::m.13482